MFKQPLVKHIYTADPSAHVFKNRIYIYPSHDLDLEAQDNDEGDQYQMIDYHVLSQDHPEAPAVDHGEVLHVKDVPWAVSQMWAPDAAEKGGKYYLYFPAKAETGIFHIGVAVADKPEGPFTAQPEPIQGSFSIDPCVFKDDDGSHYILFGGIWGGQLQNWRTGSYLADGSLPNPDEPALSCKMAKLRPDMLEMDESPQDMVIQDENGAPLLEGDNERRFFEGPWMHKYNGLYYFSYSTGDTHTISYATAETLPLPRPHPQPCHRLDHPPLNHRV
ncbi:MAG: family 43 glycosylhydrolase [Spirochaeta sp.]